MKSGWTITARSSKDAVKIIDAKDLSGHDEEYTTIALYGENEISIGDVLVYEDENGYKRAGKVSAIDAAGAYTPETPDIAEVIDTLDYSDIRQIGYADILANNTAYEIASLQNTSATGGTGRYSKAAVSTNKQLSYDMTGQAGISFLGLAQFACLSFENYTFCLRKTRKNQNIVYKPNKRW